MQYQIRKVDYSDKKQAQDLLFLLDCYAQDPMGGGVALSEQVKLHLIDELAKISGAFSLIAYTDDEQGVALVNAFESFSTFTCRKLINIHDIIVLKEHRGQGLGQKLLAAVESIALERNCGKLTLEVLEGNHTAQQAYQKFGFAGYELDPGKGRALFWQKILNKKPA